MLHCIFCADKLLYVGGRLNNVCVDVWIITFATLLSYRRTTMSVTSSYVTYIRRYFIKVDISRRELYIVRDSGWWVPIGWLLQWLRAALYVVNFVDSHDGSIWQIFLMIVVMHPPPPHFNVGVDTFGPWPVVHRRTRGGSANQKRWALFVSIRGQVTQFRSDRGTDLLAQ